MKDKKIDWNTSFNKKSLPKEIKKKKKKKEKIKKKYLF